MHAARALASTLARWHARPTPWWSHVLFVVLTALLCLAALPGGDEADDAATPVAVVVALVVGGVLLTTLFNPFAVPLLLLGVLFTTSFAASSDLADDRWTVLAPALSCAALYYPQHAWVQRRVWHARGGGRYPLSTETKAVRSATLEIGRRYLAAWSLALALAVVAALTPLDLRPGLSATLFDAGSIVVLIDALAVAPTRWAEARRYFREFPHDLRGVATVVPPDAPSATLVEVPAGRADVPGVAGPDVGRHAAQPA